MYKTFRVQNFRCFEDLELTDLARVNLIGGANNVGKTSLLEAFFLHSGDLPLRRLKGLNLPANPSWLDWAQWFFDFNTQSLIQTHSENGSLTLQLLKQADFFSHLSQSSEKLNFYRSLDENVKSLLYLKQEENYRYFVNQSGTLRTVGNLPFPLIPTYYVIPAEIQSHAEYVNWFSDLVLNGDRERLLNALQILDHRITHIELLLNGLHVHVQNSPSKPIPIVSMGRGILGLAHMILAISHYQNGILLIDEIENGLYYAILPDVWRAIHKAAVEFNVQIFATTHSEEMIQAAQLAFEDTPEDLHYIRLERDKHTQQIRAISLDAKDIAFFSSINAGMR